MKVEWATNVFAAVLDFMSIGHPENIQPKPGVPADKVVKLCRNLIDSEVFDELYPALDAGDLVEIADGIADSIYVLIYTAHAYGIPIEKVFDEVQRTNMAKFPDGVAIRREDGKIMKPSGWSPPDIKRIIEEALS